MWSFMLRPVASPLSVVDCVGLQLYAWWYTTDVTRPGFVSAPGFPKTPSFPSHNQKQTWVVVSRQQDGGGLVTYRTQGLGVAVGMQGI